MANIQLSEQEILRRQSMAKLRELGIEPYPAPLYPVNASAAGIARDYDPEAGNLTDVCIAGRMMSRRIMGAASFMELQDESGRIQVYVKRDDICPGEDKAMYNTVFMKLLDIGDIVGIRGFAFITQTGQLSIHAKELTVLSKSLKVLPVVKEADGKVYGDNSVTGETHIELVANALCSMNMWGFTPDYFEKSEAIFKGFLEENIGELKAEFYIPYVVDCMIKGDIAKTELLSTPSRWFGVTFKEDRPGVVAKFQEFADQGIYPSPLYTK